MKTVVVGTAGHIDHGKSTLVHALTGTDPDRLKEEKARGITIDLGFAHVQTGGVELSFVDVPGHERFVKNMLAGVGGVDLIMLVVAADESVMPQTREHFDICRLLRVQAGLVALTKTDTVDAEGIQLAMLEIRELVAGSFLAGGPIVPVSGRTGEGLATLREALVAVAGQALPRPTEGIPRLPIDRVFTMRGFGTVVTGTLQSGRIRVGDPLVLLTGHSDRAVTVRGIQVHGQSRREAVAGERTAVNLAGVDVSDVARGHVLTVARALHPSRRVDAKLDLLASARALRHGARVRFHHGTSEVIGRVTIAGTAAAIEGSGYVRFRLERPAVVTRGDRFIVRTYSPLATIAGGTVLDPHPPGIPIRREAAVVRCHHLHDTEHERGSEAAAALMVDEAGRSGLARDALIWRLGLSPATAGTLEAGLVAGRHAQRVGEVLVAPTVLARLKEALVERLRAHHRADPLSEGLFREEARQQLFGRGAPAVFDEAVAELVRDNVISARDRLTLAAHRATLSSEEERVAAALEQALRAAGLTPPDLAAFASIAGVSKEVTDRVVQYLLRQKRLVKIESLIFHDEVLADLKERIRALKREGGAAVRIDVAAFKDRFGVTRKFAIPLLEYLDRERVTRRLGDARAVL